MSADATPEAVRVSVVVPTYRRPELLARCLDALLRQDLDTDDYEVLVVDDEPSLAAREVVESYRCRPHTGETPALRYLARHPDRRGPAAAIRSRGRA